MGVFGDLKKKHPPGKSGGKSVRGVGPRGGVRPPVVLRDPKTGRPIVGGYSIGDKVQGKDRPLPVAVIQRRLKKAGYDLVVDGKLGRLTKSALRDYMTGPRVAQWVKDYGPQLTSLLKPGGDIGGNNPKHWNTQFGTPGTRAQAFKADNQRIDAGGAPIQGPDPMTPPTGSGTVAMGDLLSSLKAASGDPISEALAGKGISPLAASYADTLAGAQFDDAIRQLKLEMDRQPRQTEQNKRDITDWFGQVLSSLDTAGERDKAISQAGVSSVQDASKDIIASLGGAANDASAAVGEAGQQGVDTLAALGTAQGEYNADLAPILQNEKAGNLSRQDAIGSQLAHEMASQMLGLKTQRGQAKSNAMMDITRYNNDLASSRLDRLMGIKQYNNSLGQQKFQNELALSDAQMAALMNGMSLNDKTLQAMIDQQKLNGTYNPSGKKTAGKLPKSAFVNSTADMKHKVWNEALGAIYDGKKLTVPVPRAVQIVNGTIRSAGWSLANPAVLAWRNQLLRSIGVKPSPNWK